MWNLGSKNLLLVTYLIQHEFSIGKGSQASNDRWVNDRKRKFPSNSVVAEKLEAEKNKTSRGEIIVAKNNFGKFK